MNAGQWFATGMVVLFFLGVTLTAWADARDNKRRNEKEE